MKPSAIPIYVLSGFLAVCGVGGVALLNSGSSVATNPSPIVTVQNTQPSVVVQNLHPGLERYNKAWETEIARRFPRAIGIAVHGGSMVHGEWIAASSAYPGGATPVKTIVEHYQQIYPDRTIVLLICNPGACKLGIPGVYYAQTRIWTIPDRALKPVHITPDPEGSEADTAFDGTTHERFNEHPAYVGNIFEFIKD